ncbi:TPA: hypothetical protein ACH3X3_006197 [Trebouxia sp. C0006]
MAVDVPHWCEQHLHARGGPAMGDPTDAVFFIEDGNCQVGYNQRRTADEDLISTQVEVHHCDAGDPGQFIGEVLLFDNTGRDSPVGSWQTCVRARTPVRALILTVKDLKDLVTRKPAAEVELRAAMAQRKSELLRLQTLERIAVFQRDLEGQLRILLSNPDLNSLKEP